MFAYIYEYIMYIMSVLLVLFLWESWLIYSKGSTVLIFY